VSYNFMRNIEHTPPPWNMEWNRNSITIRTESALYPFIAIVNNYDCVGEGEANARLLCTAPELLSVLMFCKRYNLSEKKKGNNGLPERIVTLIEFAVALATGQEADRISMTTPSHERLRQMLIKFYSLS
jgi:hypothetical protein